MVFESNYNLNDIESMNQNYINIESINRNYVNNYHQSNDLRNQELLQTTLPNYGSTNMQNDVQLTIQCQEDIEPNSNFLKILLVITNVMIILIFGLFCVIDYFVNPEYYTDVLTKLYRLSITLLIIFLVCYIIMMIVYLFLKYNKKRDINRNTCNNLSNTCDYLLYCMCQTCQEFKESNCKH